MFKVNEYFNGNVKSIGFKNTQCPATIGVIAPGEYEFGTSTVEIMTVITGKLPANKKFKVKADEDASYLCLYR
ncbi:MAG: pyrimidine/purine nucleoside phosphorylase [Sedimentisphaerales bacterium]